MREEGRRVALIAGGAGAIGRATAERLARRGVDVAIGYWEGRERAQVHAARLQDSFDVTARPVRLDASDPASIREAVAEAASWSGRLDILVYASGIARDKGLVRLSEAEFDEVMEVNLSGAFRLIREVLPLMRARRYGRIVTVTSYAGMQGRAGQAAYAASKAALIGLTKTVALEEIGQGITANAVAPSVTVSPMTEGLKEAERERLLEAIPLGRMQTPEEAAALIDWLASEEAATVSGQVFQADSRRYGW
jgi:3-oxoacyl-[acyl-carrier protein] reductase